MCLRVDAACASVIFIVGEVASLSTLYKEMPIPVIILALAVWSVDLCYFRPFVRV